MASDSVFEDYTLKCINAMDDKINAALYEVAGEIKSQAVRNSRHDTRDTEKGFGYHVDESAHEAEIGNTKINGLWEEFGTGEHALEGKGRKGYWVFVKGSDGSSSNTGKSYSLKEAKRAMAILRSKGLEAYYTSGKKPTRALYRAFHEHKHKYDKVFQKALKG